MSDWTVETFNLQSGQRSKSHALIAKRVAIDCAAAVYARSVSWGEAWTVTVTEHDPDGTSRVVWTSGQEEDNVS